eukprot:734297-Pleurochrysis_carterae.AAC.20
MRVHHAITNIIEEGRNLAMDVAMREMMNIPEDMSASAPRVKKQKNTMRTSWLDAEQYAKEETIDSKLLGSVEDMLAICDSRDNIFFIDAAVTERFTQTGSLRIYLEEEADLGAKAGGRLRNAILTGFGSEGIMAAVRAMDLACESLLWMLLRAIGSDAHILDVLPTKWPTTLAFFEKATASRWP